MAKKCCRCREDDRVGYQVPTDHSNPHVELDQPHLLFGSPRAPLLLFTLHLPEDVIRRNGCPEQGNCAANAREREIDVWHYCIEQNCAPIRFRPDRGDDIGPKCQAQHKKNVFERSKGAVYCEIPQDSGNGENKPEPGETRQQLEATANSGQVSGNQGDVRDNEQEGGQSSNGTPIVFAQQVCQPLLRNASNFGAGKEDCVVEWCRQE